MLPTVGVWAKATKADTPKAVVEATGEGMRSETEGEVSCHSIGGKSSEKRRPEEHPILINQSVRELLLTEQWSARALAFRETPYEVVYGKPRAYKWQFKSWK